MPTDNDTDDTRNEQLTHPDTVIPIGSLGDAEAQIHIDEETYRRLREEYRRVVEHGYDDGFNTFVFNHCSTDCYVTVNGERVGPDADDDRGGDDA